MLNKGLENYLTLKLVIAELEVDDGILFPNIHTYKYVSKIDVFP
jgi:hypothetical protein